MISPDLVKKIQEILQASRRIAVVGLSPREERPSNRVARYLLGAGYTVVPVNPGHDELLGQPCYPDLRSVPGEIDIVNIFRRSDQVPSIVASAVDRGVKVIWMQEGIVNLEAAVLAEKHGITVIMDRCIKVDHQNVFSEFKMR